MKYLVDKKFNTFLISWKNPDASSRNVSFKEYIEDGVLEALRVTCEKTGSNAANIVSETSQSVKLHLLTSFL